MSGSEKIAPEAIGRATLYHGDCLAVLPTLAPASLDACVTDPPYGLGFMGKNWDHGVPGVPFWRAVKRVLKPGAHLLAFGGTRTYHRLAVAIEDAGFAIRDCVFWVYGSGFPKSLDVAKALDKAAGAEGARIAQGAEVRRIRPGADQHKDGSWEKLAERTYQPHDYSPATDAARQWEGWGTALKPAVEPIVVARKPLIGTVAENVSEYGTGALNIDGCRVAPTGESRERVNEASQERRYTDKGAINYAAKPGVRGGAPEGRWPANLIHDGSPEVLAGFPREAGASAPVTGGEPSTPAPNDIYGTFGRHRGAFYGDGGSAARFFYCAKADKAGRLGSKHPTVKPLDLMAWLCRLVTPPGGTVLDPFAGSGSTGMAALREGFRPLLIEREADYAADIRRRLGYVSGADAPLFAAAPSPDKPSQGGEGAA